MLRAALAIAVLTPLGVPDDPSAKVRTGIERLAKTLAKDGLEREARLCVAAFGELDAGTRFERLEEEVASRLEERAGDVPNTRSVKKHLRAARDVSKACAAAADSVGEAEGDAWLRRALRFDGDNEAARKALGHVRCDDGRWRSPEAAAWFARAREMADAMHRARALELEIEAVDPSTAWLAEIAPHGVSAVRHAGLTVESTLPQDLLERRFREVLRAMAWSNWLANGALSPRHLPGRYLHVADDGQYDAALTEVERGGRLSAAAVAKMRALAGTWVETDSGELAFLANATKLHFGSDLLFLFDVALPRTVRKHPSPSWVYLGHVNYVGLSFLGAPLRRWLVYRPAQGQRSKAKRGPEAMESAGAGMVGCRSWLKRLVREGRAPTLRACTVEPYAEVTGDLLLKSTSAVEWLHQREAVRPLLDAYAARRPAGPRDLAARTEAALGTTLAEFDASWERWLLADDETSLTAMLLERGGPAKETADEATRTVLDELNEVRRKAGAGEVFLDEELSRGAALHAAYLARNRDQWNRWPDFHEEWPERRGYTMEGAWAGLHGIIAFNGPKKCIREWLGTFYHRIALLDPGLLGIGFGREKKICVLDCKSLLDPSGTWTLPYPYDGQRDVPRALVPEIPNPVPERADQRTLGYPITLQLGADQGTPKVTMTLRANGKDVECYFSSPTRPTNPKLAPDGAWCLIPKAPLEANTTYWVFAEFAERSVRWSFTTGG